MLNIKNNRFYYILLSSLIILSDQYTKHIIDTYHTTYINNDFLFFMHKALTSLNFSLYNLNNFLSSILTRHQQHQPYIYNSSSSSS